MKITVSGVVGVGKSTVTQIISKKLNYRLLEEPVGNNPYLTDFYANPLKYSFAMQIWLLTERTKQLELQAQNDNIIVDRSILEDPIFAEVLCYEGKMTQRDYETYRSFFENVVKAAILTKPFLRPDLIVYLRVSPKNAEKRIIKRGRASEQSVEMQYWIDLNKHYEKWYERNKNYFNFLVIDTDNIDVKEICARIYQYLDYHKF